MEDTLIDDRPRNGDNVFEFGVPCLDGLDESQVIKEDVCVDDDEGG